MLRKIISIVLGLVLLAVGFLVARTLAGNTRKQRPVEEKVVQTVFVQEVENGRIPVTVVESGRLMAKNRIEIYSEVQGVMEPTSTVFKPGSAYRKGEIIVNIRSDDYRANLQSQKSTLQNLITSMMPDLRLDFPDAYPKWDKYLREFDMNKPVAELPEPTSEKERFFVTGKNIYTTYYATKNMELVLEKYYLRAPYSGVLTDALVTPGSLVRAGQKLGEFIDTSIYEMEISISQSILPSLSIGQKVEITDQSGSERWTGKIVRINGRVDPSTQTVKVFMDVKGSELREGMYLQALVKARDQEDAFEINRSLLMDDSQVYIVKDSTIELTSVVPVHFTDKTVVVKGLENGTQVVSRPIPGAYPGMTIAVYTEKGQE